MGEINNEPQPRGLTWVALVHNTKVHDNLDTFALSYRVLNFFVIVTQNSNQTDKVSLNIRETRRIGLRLMNAGA